MHGMAREMPGLHPVATLPRPPLPAVVHATVSILHYATDTPCAAWGTKLVPVQSMALHVLEMDVSVSDDDRRVETLPTLILAGCSSVELLCDLRL